ncbi:thioredoxin domain-containing protein [Thermodesulforhabdus norvegica]|uniref:Thioredoxin domain-containing protein n=1 Tax=Thermodesulforhabdus norvegica TaxID=39841 RepID=A0A1I4VT23_9BACT|nr:thioredoxin domain-containing protein [Thermodesulforhabdus norvegica]SFN04448.1 hypothetical protein SAMN05660836_02459 [Thermodesulforhabdus norvegica]
MPNRLINEKSPYLLQHANNPVDWYPWGNEAFERARLEQKPIFLSIGYSTCHWCHVMARESFEDPEIADFLNRHFVPVKVDREERPDVDEVYMAFCQALTGSGGWPLSVFLTPDGKPFFAGTYFPKSRRGNVPAFREVLEIIAKIWQDRKAEVEENARKMVDILNQRITLEASPDFDAERLFHDAFESLSHAFDPQWGGFGPAPKFPTPHQLMFLLRYYSKYGNDNALQMVERTLEMILTGGIYDHLGGGIHRYAVDREWMIPHFEKMLYDQAMITLALVEAHQCAGNELFAGAAREISDYVLRDLAEPEGRFFFSAEDAESGGEEGAYYLWTLSEILETLGEEDGLLAAGVFGITEEGNFMGRNVLSRRTLLLQGEDRSVSEKIGEIKSKLLRKRYERLRPFRDEKVISSWNGLEIAALASAGLVLEHQRYIDVALRVARYLWENMKDRRGYLAHTMFKGLSGSSGFLEDYAFFAFGCLELYRASGDPEILFIASEASRSMLDIFWDPREDFFKYSVSDGPSLDLIPAGYYDGAVPSAVSCAFAVVERFYRITGDPVWRDVSDKVSGKLLTMAQRTPVGATFFLSTLLESYLPKEDIVFLPGRDISTGQFLTAIARRFSPGRVVVCLPENDGQRRTLADLIPYTGNMEKIGEYSTVYSCVDGVCSAPLRASEFLRGF